MVVICLYIYRLLKHFRKIQTGKLFICKLYHRFWFHHLSTKHGIEISSKTRIGKGLYIGHPYNITINYKAIIGDFCTINKGCVIGQENRGIRKGTPVIGDKVWIGANAVIVGSISIGNDVMIAPNSFVNQNIPSHSVVFGNPCIVKSKLNATVGYIDNVN